MRTARSIGTIIIVYSAGKSIVPGVTKDNKKREMIYLSGALCYHNILKCTYFCTSDTVRFFGGHWR